MLSPQVSKELKRDINNWRQLDGLGKKPRSPRGHGGFGASDRVCVFLGGGQEDHPGASLDVEM